MVIFIFATHRVHSKLLVCGKIMEGKYSILQCLNVNITNDLSGKQ